MDFSLIPVIAIAFFVMFSPAPKSGGYVKPERHSYAQESLGQRGKSLSEGAEVALNGRALQDDKEYRSIFTYIRRNFKKVSTREAEQIAKYLVDYGKKHNIDPKFAAAVIARESGFNRKAVSRTGAKGLGQIKSFNFKSLKIRDPFDIGQNISGTTAYLSRLVGRWKNHSKKAALTLASYYKGPNAIKRAEGKYDSETGKYVQDILKNYEKIKAIRRGDR